MIYLKHYWVRDGEYLTKPGQNGPLQTHPNIPGLEVRYWLNDEDGVDYCLSVVNEDVNVVEHDPGMQILTKDEWYAIVDSIPEPEPFPFTESPKQPDWDTFEGIILQSKEMRDFIAFASTKNPLVASTFPAAFFEAKNGKYNSFKTVWNELVRISPVNVNVIQSIIGVALSLNLPEEFIGIIKDTLSHILDGSSQIAQDPDWDTFESLVLQSEEMKNFISIANAENPLIASTFAPAFFEVKNEKYNSFRIVWGELTKISPVDPNVLGAIINVAKSCDLPQEFISILEG